MSIEVLMNVEVEKFKICITADFFKQMEKHFKK